MRSCHRSVSQNTCELPKKTYKCISKGVWAIRNLTYLIQRILELEIDALSMCTHYRNTYACSSHLNILVILQAINKYIGRIVQFHVGSTIVGLIFINEGRIGKTDLKMKKERQGVDRAELTQIFLVSFTSFISSSLYPLDVIGALWENKLNAYCKSKMITNQRSCNKK